MEQDIHVIYVQCICNEIFFYCRHIPHFGPSLQAPFKEYLSAQKAKLHDKDGLGEASVRKQLFVVNLI